MIKNCVIYQLVSDGSGLGTFSKNYVVSRDVSKSSSTDDVICIVETKYVLSNDRSQAHLYDELEAAFITEDINFKYEFVQE